MKPKTKIKVIQNMPVGRLRKVWFGMELVCSGAVDLERKDDKADSLIHQGGIHEADAASVLDWNCAVGLWPNPAAHRFRPNHATFGHALCPSGSVQISFGIGLVAQFEFRDVP
jgi:hypothetical protein